MRVAVVSKSSVLQWLVIWTCHYPIISIHYTTMVVHHNQLTLPQLAWTGKKHICQVIQAEEERNVIQLAKSTSREALL